MLTEFFLHSHNGPKFRGYFQYWISHNDDIHYRHCILSLTFRSSMCEHVVKGKSFEYKDIQEKHRSATLDDKQTALGLKLIICNE